MGAFGGRKVELIATDALGVADSSAAINFFTLAPNADSRSDTDVLFGYFLTQWMPL